jgi:acetyl coenzyme A synthetase (ADP forming)-like protein
MSMKQNDIKYLFEPGSVAVLGASKNNQKLGYKVVQNIVSSGFKGRVYPINPSGGEVLGYPIYKDIADVEEDIDIACIVIPAAHTFEAVKSCADKGVKYSVIITSGFSEVGNVEEEKKIARYAAEHGMRLLGPNVIGIYSSMAPINATFGPSDITSGNVAIITQSGALGIAMIGKTKVENIGLSTIVSVGNKADIDEVDLLDYLISHEGTRVIMMYIEGVRHGERLVEALKRATKVKPIIVLKSGKSKRGALAAASHTGSLAGEDNVFDDIARQCGVLRAENLQEALNWCKFLSNSPEPEGENTAIITNGGGIGVMCADACEKYGVNLYDDIEKMQALFTGYIPAYGSAKNPVDLTGEATQDDYFRVMEVALANKTINSIICLTCETAVFDAEIFSEKLAEMYRQKKITKPSVFSLIGGAQIDDCINELRLDGISAFSDVYEAASCMGAIYRSQAMKQERYEVPPQPEIDSEAIKKVIAMARKDGRRFLYSYEAQQIMKAVGVTTPRTSIAHSIPEAVSMAEEIGYPVVLKVVSKDILHKSDVGGVALDIDDKKELIDAYEAILYNCRQAQPKAVIEGIEVTEMIHTGVEIITGARRDQSFGPIVMFGLGGIYVEVMKDIAFRAFPLSRKEVLQMIAQIRSYPLLLGVRGEKKKDISAIAESILRVGTILEKFEDISDIEINPLVVYETGKGVKAVDVRVLLTKTKEVD